MHPKHLFLLALLTAPAVLAGPSWVKSANREAGWKCCMSASMTNGLGPALDGAKCAVINTNTGANCVSALGTPIVRSRDASSQAVCNSDNLGCVDPRDDWSSSFPGWTFPGSNPPPPPPPPIGTPPSGGANGDPHFAGLDGSRFDFTGRKGGVFALLSEPLHQVNALFDNIGEEIYDGIWMTAFGFRFADNFTLTVALDKEAYVARTGLATFETKDGITRMTPATKSDIRLTIDGQTSDLLQTGQTLVLPTAEGPVTLWFPEDYVKHTDDENDGPLLFITTPYLDFKMYLESEGTPHIDWRVTIISDDLDFNELHGVLGSSINWNGMPQLAGVESDYEVQDMLATDFKFGTFRGSRRKTGRRLASATTRMTGKVGMEAGSSFM